MRLTYFSVDPDLFLPYITIIMRTIKDTPSVFQYNDYRILLKDLFQFHQKRNRHFTFRFFSQKAGLSSPSALKEVMDNKKNLTQRSILQFAIGFNLNKSETDYFTSLVYFNQAEAEDEKNRYYKELMRLQQNHKGKTLTASQYEYYSNWYNSAIRELACIKGFKDDPDWIAEKLVPAIKPSEAKKAIELLTSIGLLTRQQDGTLKQDTPKLEVDADVTGLSIRNFNRNMIQLGAEAIERFDKDEREVSGLTLGISRECGQEIKNMVREFKKQVLNYAVNDARTADTVYQLNFQLFPMTGTGGAK